MQVPILYIIRYIPIGWDIIDIVTDSLASVFPNNLLKDVRVMVYSAYGNTPVSISVCVVIVSDPNKFISLVSLWTRSSYIKTWIAV